jgi:RND superfamily putative drug exporter
MFDRLGNLVSRRWLIVILVWGLVVAILQWAAPRWWDVTQDGDLAFLPDGMPSVVGEQLLAKSFPNLRSKSQIVCLVAQEGDNLDGDGTSVAYDVARRMHNIHAVAALIRGRQASKTAARLTQEGKSDAAEQSREAAQAAFTEAESAVDEALRIDELLDDYWSGRESGPQVVQRASRPAPLADARFNQALVLQELQRPDEAAGARQAAIELDPQLANRGDEPSPEQAAIIPAVDVWTWRDDVFGAKLGAKNKHARLIVLHLATEFMATQNIQVLDDLEVELEKVRRTILPEQRAQLRVGFTGSAAVGGDMLRSAKESIENTELFTVVFVVVILALVYRSPVLVVLPLIVISVSLTVGTSLVALLTQVDKLPGCSWWDFKVFTTTKVFIVAILYGAGTDFFLFLVSRYKEELAQGYPYREAVARALAAVGDALTASAMTVVMGLSMLFFADFRKFTHSGPAIALCLLVTLGACLTLAPALLRATGPIVLWPFGTSGRRRAREGAASQPQALGGDLFTRLWEQVARGILARPGWILVGSYAILSPLVWVGLGSDKDVSYDLLKQLPEVRPSRQGTELLARYFPVGETGPLTVLVQDMHARFDTKEGRALLGSLTHELYVPGVEAVRSITDPLGDFPPNAKSGLFSRSAWSRRVASPHPRAQAVFVATEGQFAGTVARFDLLLKYDPFSPEAANVLTLVEDKLGAVKAAPDSPWKQATFTFVGTTAGTRDLRAVTQSDNRRIQRLVVLAVLAVLLVILRRPLICFYMIFSVLFSYYVTIGATEEFFQWLRGDAYAGLDWKVPLFLFVILVAIGQDYNVYLATRVFEEQQRLGRREGLRRAIVRTGGIITSCGVIMAGTFATMTSGGWGPTIARWFPFAQRILPGEGAALEAMMHLGFSLSLGVMLDTFIVRPILLPAFLALLCREPKRPEPELTPNFDVVARGRETVAHRS